MTTSIEDREAFWRERHSLARRGCGNIWPKIVQLRAELRSYEAAHGYFSAMRIEAERHLVPITKLRPSASAYKPEREASRMMRKVKKLSPERKQELVLALEGMA